MANQKEVIPDLDLPYFLLVLAMDALKSGGISVAIAVEY